jgi:hypothetical protein
MTSNGDGYQKEFDGLLRSYFTLGDQAATFVRKVKKAPNSDTRRKLVGELRNLDMKRLELLDQMDNLAKSK